MSKQEGIGACSHQSKRKSKAVSELVGLVLQGGAIRYKMSRPGSKERFLFVLLDERGLFFLVLSAAAAHLAHY